MKKRTVRYSEAFKLEVVAALESGKVESCAQARRHYGIQGVNTVQYWLRKYGKNHLIPKVVRVEKPNEKSRLQELSKEISRLKKALAESHMDAVLYRSWFKVACRKFGVKDIEAFKKKLEETL